MKRIFIASVFAIAFLYSYSGVFCSWAAVEETAMKKISLGKKLALYPSLVTVVGAEVKGKINWLLVAHTGIIGHDRILVSMNDQR